MNKPTKEQHEEALNGLVEKGLCEKKWNEEAGEWMYRHTPQGRAVAEEMIAEIESEEGIRMTSCWNCGATATCKVGWRDLCNDCKAYFTED